MAITDIDTQETPVPPLPNESDSLRQTLQGTDVGEDAQNYLRDQFLYGELGRLCRRFGGIDPDLVPVAFTAEHVEVVTYSSNDGSKLSRERGLAVHMVLAHSIAFADVHDGRVSWTVLLNEGNENHFLDYDGAVLPIANETPNDSKHPLVVEVGSEFFIG